MPFLLVSDLRYIKKVFSLYVKRAHYILRRVRYHSRYSIQKQDKQEKCGVRTSSVVTGERGGP